MSYAKDLENLGCLWDILQEVLHRQLAPWV